MDKTEEMELELVIFHQIISKKSIIKAQEKAYSNSRLL